MYLFLVSKKRGEPGNGFSRPCLDGEKRKKEKGKKSLLSLLSPRRTRRSRKKKEERRRSFLYLKKKGRGGKGVNRPFLFLFLREGMKRRERRVGKNFRMHSASTEEGKKEEEVLGTYHFFICGMTKKKRGGGSSATEELKGETKKRHLITPSSFPTG